jgi:hypothetical protein
VETTLSERPRRKPINKRMARPPMAVPGHARCEQSLAGLGLTLGSIGGGLALWN